MTPQQKRVLAASRAYNGTCSADWFDEMGADGKGRISRVPARIEELENDYDCVFEVIGWRHKTKVFRLVEGPSGVERGTGHAHVAQDHVGVSPAGVALSPGRLFEVGVSQYGFADQERAA